MRKLIFLCAENNEWFHKPAVWGIEETENVDFNHVAVMDEELKVYEAVFPRTRVMSKLQWDKIFKTVRVFEKQVTVDEYYRFMEIVKGQLNVRYSVFQCAMIYFANSISFLERKIETSYFNGKKALICSEFVGRPIAEVFNYKFENHLDTVGMDEIQTAFIDICGGPK